MSLIDPVVPLPSGAKKVRTARRRAFGFGVTVAAVSGAIGLWHLSRSSPRLGYGLVAFALAMLAYSVIHPTGALRLRAAWLRLGSLLGRVNTVVVLTVAYVLVLTPLSLVVRLFGKRSFERKKGESYFTTRSEQRDSKHFEHPY